MEQIQLSRNQDIHFPFMGRISVKTAPPSELLSTDILPWCISKDVANNRDRCLSPVELSFENFLFDNNSEDIDSFILRNTRSSIGNGNFHLVGFNVRWYYDFSSRWGEFHCIREKIANYCFHLVAIKPYIVFILKSNGTKFCMPFLPALILNMAMSSFILRTMSP